MTTRTSSPQTKAIFSEAVKHHQSDQIDKAIACYKELLTSDPSSDVYHLLAIAYAQIGQYDDACLSAKKALSLSPDHPHYLSTLGNIYRRRGELNQAKDRLLKSLSLEPKLLAAQHNLGIVYYQLDDIDQAQLSFEKVIQSIPHHAEAFYNLALCYIRKKRVLQAKNHLEQAISYAPHHPRALFQLAQIHHEEEAFGQACILYEQHLATYPNHPEALQSLGVVYLQLQRDKEGLDHLEKAVKLDDKLEDIHHNIASVYLHQRHYDLALQHWLTHLKLHHDIDTLYNIGVTYSYLGRYEEATDYLFSVLKEDANHHPTLVNLGAVYLQSNKRDLAKTYYQRAQAIKSSPSIAFVLESLFGQQQSHVSPPEYVADLFDHYAHHYDEHLTNILQYRVPQAILSLVTTTLNPKQNSLIAIDLGCGTGLCAGAIKPFCQHITGVDMSANMLECAQKKNLYDETFHGDVFDYLSPNIRVDLILCGDLLPYLGDLDPLFSACTQSLKPRAKWLFSVEMTNNPGYYLGDNARFLHNKDYIFQLAEKNHLTVIAYENIQLRTQQQAFVPGYIFCLEKDG